MFSIPAQDFKHFKEIVERGFQQLGLIADMDELHAELGRVRAWLDFPTHKRHWHFVNIFLVFDKMTYLPLMWEHPNVVSISNYLLGTMEKVLRDLKENIEPHSIVWFFRILPRLANIQWEKRPSLIPGLFEHCPKIKEISLDEMCEVLTALMFLPLQHFKEQQSLFLEFATSLHHDLRLGSGTFTYWPKLWQLIQGCRFLHADNSLTDLLPQTEIMLIGKPIEFTTSPIQQRVYSIFARIIKPMYRTPVYPPGYNPAKIDHRIGELEAEYRVGCYSLDIALTRLKINIEVDGKQHYKAAQSLRRIDRFRDYILTKLGWTVFRIPAEKWPHEFNDQRKYLKILLGEKFSHIFCDG